MFGAAFLILADLVGRIVAPAELPIGVITAHYGASVRILAHPDGGVVVAPARTGSRPAPPPAVN